MTKEELAAKLHGREIDEEITEAEAASAKAAGLLVVFGASDDLTEFRGVINDEAGAYEGAEHLIVRGADGFELFEEPDCHCRYSDAAAEAAKASGLLVEAIWCAEDDGPSWTFKTSLPHATFDVMEDGEVYCRGIVVELPEPRR